MGPSEGKRAEDFFFALKIRRLRPGANPRTWVPKASTLPLDHRSRCVCIYVCIKRSLEYPTPVKFQMAGDFFFFAKFFNIMFNEK